MSNIGRVIVKKLAVKFDGNEILKSGKKCLDPDLKNEITQSILKINKRFIAHFNRSKEWILNFQENLGQLQNIDLFSKEGKI